MVKEGEEGVKGAERQQRSFDFQASPKSHSPTCTAGFCPRRSDGQDARPAAASAPSSARRGGTRSSKDGGRQDNLEGWHDNLHKLIYKLHIRRTSILYLYVGVLASSAVPAATANELY